MTAESAADEITAALIDSVSKLGYEGVAKRFGVEVRTIRAWLIHGVPPTKVGQALTLAASLADTPVSITNLPLPRSRKGTGPKPKRKKSGRKKVVKATKPEIASEPKKAGRPRKTPNVVSIPGASSTDPSVIVLEVDGLTCYFHDSLQATRSRMLLLLKILIEANP